MLRKYAENILNRIVAYFENKWYFNMKKFRRIIRILKRTGALKMLVSFIIFYCASSVAMWLFEPNVDTIGDGLWYCFVASTTIGFGDIVALTCLGRIITILVSVYGIVVTAMIPGVVVSYYMEFLKIKEKETVSLFLENLEHLNELSSEELADLSYKIKKFNRK